MDYYIGYFYLIALGPVTPYVGSEKTEDQEGARTSRPAGQWPRDGYLDPQLGFLQNCSLRPTGANPCCPPRQGLSVAALVSPTYVRVNKGRMCLARCQNLSWLLWREMFPLWLSHWSVVM